MRPFDSKDRSPGSNNWNKAVEYARWLAEKRKNKLPAHSNIYVKFVFVRLSGFKTPIPRAEYVKFNNVKIKLPHVRYDPTLPGLPLDPIGRIVFFREKQTSPKVLQKVFQFSFAA